MKTTTPTLPDELVFEPDGHLGEAALACAADGEIELLPAPALAHLELCAHCTQRLGEAALLSLSVGEALRDAAPAMAAAPVTTGVRAAVPVAGRALALRRRPLPVGAIAAALAVAVLTAWPSLVATVRGAPGAVASAIAAVPFVARMAASIAEAPWTVGTQALALKLVSAVVMMAIGLRVARAAPHPGSLQQGGA